MRRVVAALAIAGAALGLSGCGTANQAVQTCQVQDKDRTTTSKGASIYRVYTSCGVFEVEDNLFLGKFNSADTFARLQPGRTYELTTYGWRNGFLSLFPNITDAREVRP